MYHQFYQFRENPFNVTADPDFFFSSDNHCQAFSNLVYGVQQRKGILMVTGEIGTGKTTLCQKLLRQFGKKTKFALILNPKFSEIELLKIIANDLGLSAKQNDKISLIHALNKFLIKMTNRGYNIVIIIDEAQNLDVQQLEQIRLLSNLETEKYKLLQIILIGQPELHHKIQLPELRQLRQRISVYFNLKPLEKSDIKNYIRHRIEKATHTAQGACRLIFTEEAIEAVYQYTKGYPRTINILCDRALLAGFVAETYSINHHIIENCAKEVLYCEHHL